MSEPDERGLEVVGLCDEIPNCIPRHVSSRSVPHSAAMSIACWYRAIAVDVDVRGEP